ncbi:histidine kinase [Herminiimonas sp. KBW02]|uniref:GAF domain-containing protein n=1 Tax=Herminiimonas sp. KBW02 TaxID=2153363 RepID=UPI000F5B42C9|nr:GAF domain-containing protein [Herminiimonas sp. KBW02]RQO38772.1 histidine kinase [Herminiimonas sp. KBW02]
MIKAPIPDDEDDRLYALRQLLILDTPPEERFNRIVSFAAHEFDVPIVLITLLDTERQWFKASVGLDVCETARDVSFCGHAIMSNDTMVVADATKDARFSDNPFVLEDPQVRFYAGAPLTLASGQNVGTLCLIDNAPRTMDAVGLAILAALRDLAVEELTNQFREPAEHYGR